MAMTELSKDNSTTKRLPCKTASSGFIGVFYRLSVYNNINEPLIDL